MDEIRVRTDLAHEAYEEIAASSGAELAGIRTEKDEAEEGMHTHWLWIEDDQAAQRIGRGRGVYLTLEAQILRAPDPAREQKVTAYLTQQFDRFLEEVGIDANASCLWVGLGNHNVTPDAFGPQVAQHAIITRHLFALSPQEVQEGYRPVSALAPGVMGLTGMETSEIIGGVVQRLQPDWVLAFDALAARALHRVNTTIQICSTGICPGSGVGNRRRALDQETLGVPVIAVGVPTVVDAATIAYDSIQAVLQHLGEQSPQAIKEEEWLGLLGQLSKVDQRQIITEVLAPLGHNLWVTPKEVDAFVDTMARLVANSVNCSLHSAVTMDNLASYSSH